MQEYHIGIVSIYTLESLYTYTTKNIIVNKLDMNIITQLVCSTYVIAK